MRRRSVPSGSAVISIGRSVRRLTRRSSTSKSALSQNEIPFARMTARVSAFMIGAAARRQHLRAAVEQPRDDPRLAGAEIGFAVRLENFRDGHAGRGLDLGIGIDERQPEPASQAGGRSRICRRPSCRRAPASGGRARYDRGLRRRPGGRMGHGKVGHYQGPVTERRVINHPAAKREASPCQSRAEHDRC